MCCLNIESHWRLVVFALCCVLVMKEGFIPLVNYQQQVVHLEEVLAASDIAVGGVTVVWMQASPVLSLGSGKECGGGCRDT